MLNNLEISEFVPFATWSTFQTTDLYIPKSMFLGGLLYLTPDTQLPVHVAYMDPASSGNLGTWRVIDSVGTICGDLIFRGRGEENNITQIVGTLVAPDGAYGGCIKANDNLNNVQQVASGGVADNASLGFSAFLQDIAYRRTLDVDTLVFDPCLCVLTRASAPVYQQITNIRVPQNTYLAQDLAGCVYLGTSSSAVVIEEGLRTLNIVIPHSGSNSTSHSLSAKDVTITPGHQVISSGYDLPGGDVRVTRINGGIVISDRARVPEDAI